MTNQRANAVGVRMNRNQQKMAEKQRRATRAARWVSRSSTRGAARGDEKAKTNTAARERDTKGGR
jgi:hypothetical protein